jgi:acetate kinase
MTKLSAMKSAKPRILTINGGSSSIKFALFEAGDPLRRILEGGIDRIGLPQTTLRVKGLNPADNFSRLLTAPDHAVAVGALMDWIEERCGRDALTAVGHRVVHGGPKYSKPQRITAEMIAELHQLSPFDPEHLPEEILLIEAFQRRFPELPQLACFDTAFHHDLPRVAQLLPIPRRYEAQGCGDTGFTDCRMNFSWVNWLDWPERTRHEAGSSSPTSAMAQAWRRCVTVNPWTPAWVSHRPPGCR